MSRDEEDVAMEEKPEETPDDGARAAPPTLDIESAMALEEGVVAALKTVFDPEIPVDIYELGLIYDIDVAAGGRVKVRMTLTSPACPVAGSLPGEVEQKVQGVAGVEAAEVELVWDPPWNPGMMSEAARLELGMF
jgi:FeS assembly SUF system protein